MAGPARMSDVARLARVSVMTVSRALNGNPNVTESMRKKVLAAAEQLRYQPNEIARSLREQRTRQIGIIVPYLFDAFFAECAHAVSTVAKKHTYSVVLSTSNEDPETEFQEASRMLRRNVDGLIVIPTRVDGKPSPLMGSEFERLPLVTLDRPIDGMNRCDSVVVENERGAQMGTEHLLALGHTRVAYIGLTDQLYTMQMRNRGYTAAMKAAGLKPQRAILSGVLGDSLAAVRKLLSTRTPPTALFCANNLITLHVLHSLQAMRMHPPNPIALVGFDDFGAADLIRPGITVIRQPSENLGSLAAQMLFSRLGSSQPLRLGAIEVLPVELIMRGSCGASVGVTRSGRDRQRDRASRRVRAGPPGTAQRAGTQTPAPPDKLSSCMRSLALE